MEIKNIIQSLQKLLIANSQKFKNIEDEISCILHNLDKKINVIQLDNNLKFQIYTALYAFFSQFYNNGIFQIQYKKFQYLMPFDNDISFHWLTQNQYYIGSYIPLQDYEFKALDYNIKFKITNKELNFKDIVKKKYFILQDNPFKFENNTLTIYLKYDNLTKKEIQYYNIEKNSFRQRHINKIICFKALEFFKKTHHQLESLLLKQLNKFTNKQLKDYFIHKDLKSFLFKQLDRFIKNNILNYEQKQYLNKKIIVAQNVKIIAQQIIKKLAKIENIKKALWERKRLVLRTDYIITLDKILEYIDQNFFSSLIKKVLNNQKQLDDWKDLGFGIIKTEQDLNNDNYKHLPIDTKYFNSEFKYTLLEKITENNNLDEVLDGLLIKSQNWQALNTILETYKKQIQLIYIDPPYNTGHNFSYLDKYKRSSWLSFMKDRLSFVNSLLKDDGTFYLHLDDNSNYLGKMLLQDMNFKNIQEIIFNTNATKDEEADIFGYKSFGNKYVIKHNTIFYCSNDNPLFNKLWKPNRNTSNMKIGWLDLLSRPNKKQPNKIEDLDFFIEKYDSEGLLKLERIEINESIYPIGDLWTDIYSFTQSEMRISENISFLTQKPENMLRRILQTSSNPNDIILDYFAGSGTTLAVAQKLRRKWIGIEMADYFNEFYLDKGRKKVGLMGRLKNVLNGDKQFYAIDKKRYSHLSNDINWQGGGFFQYQVLEQYEDTLDNLEIEEQDSTQIDLNLSNEYLFHYLIDLKTRKNTSLLNIEALKTPFSYKLKVNLEEVGEPQEVIIDLPETFNYLLGLKVKKTKVRNQNRKYLFIMGEKESQNIVVVWRDYNDNWTDKDYNADGDFIMKQLKDWKPQIVYINGKNTLTPVQKDLSIIIRSTDAEFKSLMG